MKRIMIAAVVTAFLIPAAGVSFAKNSKSMNSPGHKQTYPGEAKKFAPGHMQKEPGDAKNYAPGRQNRDQNR